MSTETQVTESGDSSASHILAHAMDRRGFMARAAVVGAAAAVAPALLAAGPPPGKKPQVVPPPFQVNPLLSPKHKIERNEVSFDGEAGRIRAYLARPRDVATAPGILVIHENQGLQPYLRDVVEGLATTGYIAVVADLLSRLGGTAVVDNRPGGLGGDTTPSHFTDLTSTLDYLGNQSGVAKIGVIGFCFGGALTWRMAAFADGLSAAVPFYGAARPDVVAAAAAGDIEAAVFAVYAETDGFVNETRDAILAAMDTGGTTYQTKTYTGTLHAFHNHTNPARYHPEAAAEAWEDAKEWLSQHLI